MAFTANVASTSSVPAAFGFTIKLRSFELNPTTPVDEPEETEDEEPTDDKEEETEPEPTDEVPVEPEDNGEGDGTD